MSKLNLIQRSSNKIQWQMRDDGRGMETRPIFVHGHEITLDVRESRVWGGDCETSAWVDGQRAFRHEPPTVYLGIQALEEWLSEWVSETYGQTLLIVTPIGEGQAEIVPLCGLCGSQVDIQPFKDGDLVICASCRAEVS